MTVNKRIVVIVNKAWEAAAVAEVFKTPPNGNLSARPHEWSAGNAYPSLQDQNTDGSSFHFLLVFGSTAVEFWCLADFKNTSDSGEKCGFIPKIIAAGPTPALVVAAGTAASLSSNQNGNVVIGGRTFIHDPGINPMPSAPNWPTEAGGLMSHVLDSKFDWSGLAKAPLQDISVRFVLPQANPGSARVSLDKTLVSVGDVNVTKPADYAKGDRLAIEALYKVDSKANIGSVDTTLALVRALVSEIPFLFVSGIANRLGEFEAEVNPYPFSQNFAASQNIGVTLAWILPLLV